MVHNIAQIQEIISNAHFMPCE